MMVSSAGSLRLLSSSRGAAAGRRAVSVGRSARARGPVVAARVALKVPVSDSAWS
ncbi:hypothetical protein WKI71_05770 [Streptomyces sp. MS1.AVA.1]|uniref:Uncharacterized protein n=1 Tax=Streptomyces machairae TaxID=3134109 RepID=A0ABU8UHZ3_9ACTN